MRTTTTSTSATVVMGVLQATGAAMTDAPLPADALLREHIPLELAGFRTRFYVNDLGMQVLIIEERDEGDLRLFTHEARALRDWLNKVLP
jgi:hypothetical protein